MFTIEFIQPFNDVSVELRAELRRRLQEVARNLTTIAPDSAIWPPLAEGGMFLEIGAWRFHYQVDRKKRRILVDAAAIRRE